MNPTTNPTDETTPEPALTGRAAAMAEIAARVQARDAGDLQAFDEATGTVQATAETPEPEPEQQPEPAAAPAEPPKPRMVAIVVDGQTIEVAEDRIIEAGKRTLQKESAADRRLQEAENLRRQAQAMLAQHQRPSTDAAPTTDPAPSQDAQPAQPQITPEALDGYLESKLYMRDAQKAAEKFKQDFPDIVNDPYLAQLAGQLEQQRLATKAALGESFGDPFEAYRAHGEAIQKWLAQKNPTPQVSADKTERKRTITAVGGVNAKAPAAKEDKPLTVAEQIEAMRVARLNGSRPRPQPIR